jgi:hypothetical protein
MEGTITHTPHRESMTRPEKPPPPYVGWRAEREGAWTSYELNDGDRLPGDLDGEHRAAITPWLARRKDEVARRVAIRTLPLARVAHPAVPDWIFYAFPGRPRLEVVRLPSGHLVTRIALIALAVLVMLVLALALIR